MTTTTPARFREVEPLCDSGGRPAAYIASSSRWLAISQWGFDIREARALRDWLTKALPEEKP